MTTRSVRIPDDVDERLVAFAASERISVNSVIVRALDDLMNRRAQERAVMVAADLVFSERKELFTRLADT